MVKLDIKRVSRTRVSRFKINNRVTPTVKLEKNKDMKKIKNIHFGSLISMSLVLFLIGLVSLLLFVANDMSIYVKENINLSIILDDNAEKADVNRIENYLTEASYAKNVDYMSKDAALKEHIAALGDNPQDFLGFNPLKASLEVKLNAEYANPDSVQVIESKLKAFQGIERIAYQKDLIGLVNDNVRKISVVLLGLALVLLIVAIALINNTIRLSVYSNRFLINTMQMVGATNWFIRKPYLRHSVINGAASALLALLLLGVVVYYIMFEFGLSNLAFNIQSGISVSVIVLLSGMLLMAASTYLSIGRYLKMNTNDMYLN
jgi:cell division transport system permease protein